MLGVGARAAADGAAGGAGGGSAGCASATRGVTRRSTHATEARPNVIARRPVALRSGKCNADAKETRWRLPRRHARLLSSAHEAHRNPARPRRLRLFRAVTSRARVQQRRDVRGDSASFGGEASRARPRGAYEPGACALLKDDVESFEQAARVAPRRGERHRRGGEHALLIEAGFDGARACAKLLIQRGAAIDAVNKRGDSAIGRAMEYGKWEVVALLLDQRPTLPPLRSRSPRATGRTRSWTG